MSLLGLLSFSRCGLEACMTASSGRTAVCLGASGAQNCLTAGCKLAYFSSSAMQPAHMQAKSWSAPLVFCAGRSITIRQDTGINNNAVTRDPVLHGHLQCIKNRAQKTNKYRGTASDFSPAQSSRQQKEHIVMSGAA